MVTALHTPIGLNLAEKRCKILCKGIPRRILFTLEALDALGLIYCQIVSIHVPSTVILNFLKSQTAVQYMYIFSYVV